MPEDQPQAGKTTQNPSMGPSAVSATLKERVMIALDLTLRGYRNVGEIPVPFPLINCAEIGAKIGRTAKDVQAILIWHHRAIQDEMAPVALTLRIGDLSLFPGISDDQIEYLRSLDLIG